MLLESFKASSDGGYVIIPLMVAHDGYISYKYGGMMQAKVSAWKQAITIPEVRHAAPTTSEGYLKILQALGIRCAIHRTDACTALRKEYKSIPLHRRIK